MRLLIDANCLLWWVSDPTKLSDVAREAIAADTNDISVSVGSLWEIAIKRGLGKLRFPHDFATVLRDEEFALLPITYAHLGALESLPLLHRDPFDRLLIAQSVADNLPIVTADRTVALYAVKTFW